MYLFPKKVKKGAKRHGRSGGLSHKERLKKIMEKVRENKNK